MAFEIERKFLVKGDYKDSVTKSDHIVQGYIATLGPKTVRIRIRGDKGYITIKGKSNATGVSRFEWEKEIPLGDAVQLMDLCDGGVVEKVRHLVPFAGHTFEVDEFLGDNSGLTVAEVELRSEDEVFDRPSWLGEEVTQDRRYRNSNLLVHPFKDW
ncbi:MAG: CYTH domain-containing protein [Bacteroidales bacterium]|jgi:CYTH domain-containing protein|nr:CYTH domain-containing protein [Bacteroidales bacterium]